ncbi:hypothetical protein H0H92_004413, partial [Tricholoma furcatifolium]
PDGIDPKRLEWLQGVQKKFLQKKLMFMGPSEGKDWHKAEYADWRSILTLKADHERRRRDYLRSAAYGIYLEGHQYDVVITKEEREKELSGEGLLKFLLEGIEIGCTYEYIEGPEDDKEEEGCPYGVEL